MRIELKKDDVLIRYLEEPGKYIIGRSANCDLVLHGNNISRRHAVLTISERGWLIEDLGSQNGTFVNQKPIQKEKILSSTAIVSIGDYTLSCVRECDAATSQDHRTKNLSTVALMLSSRPRFATVSFILISILFSISVLTLIHGSYLKERVSTWEEERAKTLVTALADHNRSRWQQPDLSSLDVDFYEKQPGVMSIYLVDLHGRILAPIEQMNHVLDDPAVVKSLNSKQVTEQVTEAGNLLVSCPVIIDEKIVGAAILLYRCRTAAGLFRDRIFLVSGALFIIVALGCVAGIFLVRILLIPWVRLSEDLEIAISQKKTIIKFPVLYAEIEACKVQLDRVLLKLAGEYHATVSPSRHDLQAEGKEHNGAVEYPENMDMVSFQSEEAACYINLEHNAIVDSSPIFREMFSLVADRHFHILEVFIDPAILSEVTNLLAKGSGEAHLQVMGVPYLVSGDKISQKTALLKLTFTQI